MQLVSAFLMATAFCYLAAACLCFFFKKPSLAKMSEILQTAFYFVLFLCNLGASILNVYSSPSIVLLALPFAIFYSLGSVNSFLGLMVWRAYWKDRPDDGSAAGQIAMGFWDLALAVCYFYLL